MRQRTYERVSGAMNLVVGVAVIGIVVAMLRLALGL